MPTRVIVDSTSCLPKSELDAYSIREVSLFVSFGEDTERELDIDTDAFYRRLAASPALPTSSQPAPAELQAAFREAVEAGDEVVGCFISSDMSGTFEGARVARDAILAEHPDARIEIVDSRSNCMELGLCAIAAAKAAAEGASAADAAEAARATIPRTRFVFAPATLEYLRRGGRIGGASALLGAMLQVRPILTVANGKTEVLRKVRTHTRALGEMLGQMQADGEKYGLEEAWVHHIADETGGRAFAEELSRRVGDEVPVRLVAIGPVIGLHVGPGTIGLVYKTREPIA